MQSISTQGAKLLSTSLRAPAVYIWAQLPAIINQYGNIDPAKLGSQIILDKVTSFQVINVLDIGADKMDFSLEGTTWDYSPLTHNSKFGKYFAVGAVDIKYQAFLGIAKDGASTVWPKGVYVSETVTQDVSEGLATFSVNTLDQFSLFMGNVYTSFPPRLYGVQNSTYFNPNYALKNPSGDLKAYVSDTCYWMQSANLPIWNSDYIQVAVYSSTVNNGTTPIPNSGSTAYTIDYNKGWVTFTTAQPAGSVISVDARPLAMKPELALYHLFVDFGAWDPNFIKFDQTGTVIPLIELSRDRSIMDIARDIVALIGPRGQRWRLWIDESGYLRLSEQASDGPSVVTLIDTKDIIRNTPEYSTKTLNNVIRAQSQISSNQPIEVISYDIYSISTYGQKPTFDVPTQLVNMTKTMDAGSAMSYLNGICNSLLFEYCRPSLVTEIEILPNPALQVGDAIDIIEAKTGLGINPPTNNVAPHSDTLFNWITNGTLTVSTTGPNGSNAAQYTAP